MNLPPDVQRVKKALARDRKNELHQIAKALISDDPDLVKMWKSISRRVKFRASKEKSAKYLQRIGEEGWVLTFLHQCHNTANPPPYFKMPSVRRQRL